MTTNNQEDSVSEQTAAADPFAAGATADPFASGAPAAAPAPETNGETPVASEEIPTVNADGDRIDPKTGEVLAEAQPATPEEAAAQPDAAAAPPAVEEAPAPEPQPAEAGDGQPPEQPPAAPAEAPEPPEAASAPEEAPQPPQTPPAPPAAEQPPAPAPAAAATEEQPPASAPPADEGKSPFRHYKLLYQTGESIWTEYDLTKLAADMKQHAESVDGEMFLRARNADHARRIAWVLFDRPANGVTVNPVAKSSWKPKRLAPAPPKPERERLSIT